MEIGAFTPNINNPIKPGAGNTAITEQSAPGPSCDNVSIQGSVNGNLSLILSPSSLYKSAATVSASTFAASECSNNAVSSLVPMPLSLSIADQLNALSRKNVSFISRPALHLPGIKDKQLSASDAAGILTEKGKMARKRLFVKVNNEAPVQCSSKEDVERLAAFKDPSGQPQPVRELVELLKTAEKMGCSVHSDECDAMGSYGAFRHLTASSDESALVTIKYNDASLITLKPGQPVGEDSGAFTDLSKKFPSEDAETICNALPLVLKEIPGVPLDDRVALMDGLLKHVRPPAPWGATQYDKGELEAKSVQKAYENVTGRFAGTADFLLKEKMLLDIMGSSRYKMTPAEADGTAELIGTRLVDHPEEYEAFAEIIKLKRIHPEQALKVHKCLMNDKKTDDIMEKVSAYREVYGSIYKNNGKDAGKARNSYLIASTAMDSQDTLAASVERLKVLTRAVKRFSGAGFAQTEGETLLLWVAKQKKNGTFGEMSLDESVSLLVQKMFFADSLDAALKAMLSDVGVKDSESMVHEYNEMLEVDGVRLKIRSDVD